MKNNIYLFVGVTALLLAGVIAGTRVYQRSQESNLTFLAHEKSELFIRDHSPRFGKKDAKVYLVEFLDPECESCRVFYPEIKKMLKEFDGKLQLVIRYAPFHQNSKHAIKVLEATKEQGKYHEALEFLFETQPVWADHHHPRPELVYKLLPKIGIDIEKLKKDMQSPKIKKVIDQDFSDLKELNVRGTPTFFVNGEKPNAFGIVPLRLKILEMIKKVYGDE